MDWRIKGLVQGVLSFLPGGERVNDLLQRVAGGRKDLAAHVADKVREDWLVHMRHLDELRVAIQGREMLEIGTGWLPVLPLGFALAGVGRCHTMDLKRHMRPEAATLALRMLEPHLGEIAAAAGQPPDRVADRWRAWTRLPDGVAVLEAAGVRYHAPADATASGLPDRSCALVFSNSVLEHVPAPALPGLMREARRLLAPDGVALHGVNCGDHYAYFDRSITPIHYLRFSEREWRLWNNDILFQNRLRPVDFLDAARAAGLEVVLKKHRPRPELLARLPSLPIADEFRRYPPEELCCTSIDFAAALPRAADEGGPPTA